MTTLERSVRRATDVLSCPACSSFRSAPIRPLLRFSQAADAATSQTPHRWTRIRWTSSSATSNNAAAGLAGSSASAARMSAEQARRAVELSRQRMYAERAKKSRSVVFYAAGTIVLSLAITYAAVPAYRAFCSATGFAGTPMTDPTRFSPDRLYVTPETQGRKRITVHFEATASDTLPWKFEPQQRSVKVLPGETALAFYTAKNNSDKDLIGIATYNMTPEKIAPYFAKVECFCFEEQKIRAGEEVDLPVFFFIDRDLVEEPQLQGLDDVVLSYTFFKARRNDQGHLVPDASEEEVQKSQGFENYELAKKAHKLSPPPSISS